MADTDAQKTPPPVKANEEEKPKKLRYHLLKSKAFRTIHADGVFGGVTPRLSISATFFNERNPLPDQIVHEIKDDGTLGAELRDERIIRDGLVRELEANVLMDIGVAKVLVVWLQEKIDFIEKTVEEAEREQAKTKEGQSNA